jgi:polyisoprenoid-binding protein YceI
MAVAERLNMDRLPTLSRGSVIALAFFAVATGPAHANEWAVDRDRSRLGFEFLESGNPVVGHFARWVAEIRYDPAELAAARVRLQVETASAATGERRRDEVMSGPDWLDSARVPAAVFEAEGFRALGGERFETTGRLWLRNGVRPLTLAFTLAIEGDEARARGQATLVRTQFGIGQGQWAGQTVVGLEVSVVFELVARRLW